MLPIFLKTGKFLTKNSSIILTGIGCIGVITTTILTYKSTCRTLEKITEMNIEAEETLSEGEEIELEKADIFKACWKYWIPVAVTGGITIASIIFAHKITAGKLAALASAYELSEQTRKRYKEALEDKLGPNKAKDVMDAAQNLACPNDISGYNIVETGHGSTVIYDAFHDRLIRSSVNYIDSMFNKFNDKLRNQAFGEASMADLYSTIGLSFSENDNRLMWIIDGDKKETYDIHPIWTSKLLEDGTAVNVMGLYFGDNLPKMQIYA